MKRITGAIVNAIVWFSHGPGAFITLFIAGLFILFVALDAIFPFNPEKVPYSRLVLASDSTLLHGFLSADDKWRMKAAHGEITPDLRKAFIFKEDKWFYYHPGVNPFSIVRAAINNLRAGRRTSGASTITMQLARMLKPAPRNIGSKVTEMFRALQLEYHYSKDEILRFYLNKLPFGGNVEGVKAASLIYFGQAPKALSLAQVAMLTVIPNNPNALKPGSDISLLKKERNKWLMKMKNAGLFNESSLADALTEPFEHKRFAIPVLAGHLAYRFRFSSEKSNEVVTSIVPEKQFITEQLVANHVRWLRPMNITNAAALVINNHNMHVEAYVGSAGFFEKGYQGQVDGVQALRSPGSALKPLLYALCFDHGLICPRSVVTDVPVNFSGYRPENYDETYRGKITVEQALAQSLNVPAVKLLDQLGPEVFINSMASSGFRWVDKNKSKLGLSIVLGGCGTTLAELAALYAAFANQGIYRPLVFSHDQKSLISDSVCSPGAAYMVTEILTSLRRPDLPNQYQSAADLPKIAWKTGTSYGRRDGWAIGYNRDYTVAIWTGNFPGNGEPELNGTDCAVPLLFNIFRALSLVNRPDWFVPPPDLDFRLVCSETGMPPDTFCHQQVMDYFLPGISPAMRCNHLKYQYTDKDETMSYCVDCRPSGGYAGHWYPYYPPELIAWYNEMNIPFVAQPQHNPVCRSVASGKSPHITSLTDGAEYLLLYGKKQQLMLACNAENGVKSVYWYLNNHFYKKALPSEKVFFTPLPGNYKISCSDDRGRTSDIRLKISYY